MSFWKGLRGKEPLMTESSLPVLVIGSGGHAKVLIDAMLLNRDRIEGITDTDVSKHGGSVLGVPVTGGDERALKLPAHTIRLVNGFGSIRNTELRSKVFESFKAKGYSFHTVIHPASVIAADVKIGEGAQIMAGAVIQAGSVIGANVIINTGTVVDHDCVIGAHSHLAPGVTVSGGVQIEEGVHVGTGATVIQGVRIGSRATVGAGSVVLKDVPKGMTVVGVPAKTLK